MKRSVKAGRRRSAAQRKSITHKLYIKDKVNRNAESSKKEKFYEFKLRRFHGKCFKCNKIGYRSRDCNSKKIISRIRLTMHYTQYYVMPKCLNRTFGVWTVELQIICINKQRFSELDESMHSNYYTTAEHSVKSLGINKIQVNVMLNYHLSNSVCLQNVTYVPTLRNNFVSVN